MAQGSILNAFAMLYASVRHGHLLIQCHSSAALMDTLNVLLPHAVPHRDDDRKTINEEARTRNVVEQAFGPKTGIGQIQKLLRERGYSVLANDLDTVHATRKRSAHPQHDVAERLETALGEIALCFPCRLDALPSFCSSP